MTEGLSTHDSDVGMTDITNGNFLPKWKIESKSPIILLTMNKQIARVDEYINDAAAHMAAVKAIIAALKGESSTLNSAQFASIRQLETAVDACNDLIAMRIQPQPRYKIKHTKLTTQQIIEYVNEAQALNECKTAQALNECKTAQALNECKTAQALNECKTANLQSKL
ncbi:hypothetical protein D5b_00295 [Faustovirus]|nr:hypothetical protein D5b_00295 [Faustovirus]